MSKLRLIIGAIIAIAIIAIGCLVWELTNSRIAPAVVEKRVKSILGQELSLDFSGSLRVVNASGGMVGSPFTNFRWWKEYFFQGEGNFDSLVSWSRELGKRKQTPEFAFLPSGSTPGIMPHRNSTNLAPWWQPETNKEAMYMYAGMNNGDWIVHLYGYRRGTNGLVYVQIIEN